MQDIWDGGGMEDCLGKEQEPPKRGMEWGANMSYEERMVQFTEDWWCEFVVKVMPLPLVI